MGSHEGTSDRPITLVGAGLVGSLLAIYLARRGCRVTILERRPDMRVETLSAGRSINLALSARGLDALRRVGLEDEALRHAVPMRGRMIHAASGELALQAYGKDDSQCINSISRAWLNRALMSAAEATGRVSIGFRKRVSGAHLANHELLVHDEATGQEDTRRAQVVIGTDGSASALRTAMLDRPGFATTYDTLAHGYKELTIPAGPAGAFAMEKHALHIWPRGTFMLIALPNGDGSFTCTLFLPYEGAESFAALTNPEAVRAFFAKQFPDALALLPQLEAEFFEHPTGSMVTVKASPWHSGGDALVLGDAAHAMVPFYGQGMNCGFEDCVALDASLGAHSDYERAFASFYRERKPNADAIADMAVENFVEMRDKTADPRFLLEKQIEKALLNAFPGEFISRYSLVSFSLEPYSFAYRVGEIAASIIAELAHGIERVDQLDTSRAAHLIRERLTPFVREHTLGGATAR